VGDRRLGLALAELEHLRRALQRQDDGGRLDLDGAGNVRHRVAEQHAVAAAVEGGAQVEGIRDHAAMPRAQRGDLAVNFRVEHRGELGDGGDGLSRLLGDRLQLRPAAGEDRQPAGDGGGVARCLGGGGAVIRVVNELGARRRAEQQLVRMVPSSIWRVARRVRGIEVSLRWAWCARCAVCSIRIRATLQEKLGSSAAPAR
jgi:hypothetical protein